jgi:hypothetical protein
MTTNFNKNIMKAVDDNVNAFIERISTIYKIPHQELIELWSSDPVSPMIIDDEKPMCKVVVVSKKAVKSPNEPSRKCPYLFARGPNKGCLCSADIRQLDREFCPKHTTQKPTCVKERKTQMIPDTDDINKSLHMNKSINKLWNKNTGMVFNSNEDRTVIKRLVDGELTKLTSDDIDTCISIGFAYRLEEDDVAPMEEESSPIVQDTINEVENLLKKMSVDNNDFGSDSDSESDDELEEEE